MSTEYEVGALELKELDTKLSNFLKIRTFPIGLKQYKSIDDMRAVTGVRWPAKGRLHTTLSDCNPKPHSRIHYSGYLRQCAGW